MTDLFKDKITVYIDVPATETEGRMFDRHIIEKCQISDGTVERNDGTVSRAVNAKTVISKDVKYYVSPEKYRSLLPEARKTVFTVGLGDFIVFGEVTDTVANAKEFADLQTKYKGNGIKAVSVNVFISGLSTDNIQISNA